MNNSNHPTPPKIGLLLLAAQLLAGIAARAETEWQPFTAKANLSSPSMIDLRFLNEEYAGQHGFIQANEGHFVRGRDGQPVRFWGVNGPPSRLRGQDLKRAARLLARYGVNLARVHGGMFDKDGEVDMAKVRHALEVVEALKAEGIYTHFSIYFPLWFTPRADLEWLEGYDGKKHPFAALEFNPRFQEKYRAWWRALLTTPSPASGKKLIDEPAVMGVEMQNEDSFFFWTFSEANLPEPQLARLEKMFGDWLARRHGTIEAALARWKGEPLKRDRPAEGRVAFQPLWAIFNRKTARDRDTAAFLWEVQTAFYRETYAFLRSLGFKGVICASNWSTASPEVFGPLEKLSYTVGDFIDRHGYFGCLHQGDNAAWSVRPGHTYADRSALRFDAESPGKPRQFVHPAMDPKYDDKPSMISETTFNRPNRYRSEAPWYYAVYGALQDSDAIVHFAFDGAEWQAKPGFWMQPWTLMSPALMGQFPACAILYRRGLITPGATLAEVHLNRGDLLALGGTPLPQEAALDELRLRDVPTSEAARKPGRRLDPLLHYAGQTVVRFVDTNASTRVTDTRGLIDHVARTVTSSTGEVRLNYSEGLLRIDAPSAQGVCGALQAAGLISLADLTVESPLDLGAIVAVALDAQPLARSGKILLQAMSEEQTTGFRTERAGEKGKRILDIGRDPWLIRGISGRVRFKRPDAAALAVTALDHNGVRGERWVDARDIDLRPATLYYLIESAP